MGPTRGDATVSRAVETRDDEGLRGDPLGQDCRSPAWRNLAVKFPETSGIDDLA